MYAHSRTLRQKAALAALACGIAGVAVLGAPPGSPAQSSLAASSSSGGKATASKGGKATASAGGVAAPADPKISDVVCLRQCVGGRKATPGARVRVKGAFLHYTSTVVFRGSDGPLPARYSYRDEDTVHTVVPRGAVSGRPYVIDSRGVRSNRSPHVLKVLPVSAIPEAIFPVRGPHQYWDGWGAGRGHQGTDVGAACGTRLVAAMAGRVQYKAYHGAAGNYVVIDVKGQNVDQAYMHLLQPTPLRVGQRVSAGQPVGAVGETGNARGCHLHFEYWVGDWYGGGHPVDSEPYLRKWDRGS